MTTVENNLLDVCGLKKTLKYTDAVQDINFNIKPFQKTAVIGETGSGKTTLLKMIAGLIQPDGGEIYFKGSKIKGPDDCLVPGHPEIAFLSQHFELFNNYYVHEFLSYKNEYNKEETNALFSLCKIDHLLHRKTHELSGGERQRIALTKQLLLKPSFLLLDEPFSNLDGINKISIKKLIEDIINHLKITCLMVSHDANEILSWAEKIYVIHKGQIVQDATPVELYHQPNSEYCAGLLGNFDLIENPSKYPLFSNIKSDHPLNKKLFIRPDYFHIEKSIESEDSYKVDKVIFNGNYSIVMIDYFDIKINAITNHFDIQNGDFVHVNFKSPVAWFL